MEKTTIQLQVQTFVDGKLRMAYKFVHLTHLDTADAIEILVEAANCLNKLNDDLRKV